MYTRILFIVSSSIRDYPNTLDTAPCVQGGPRCPSILGFSSADPKLPLPLPLGHHKSVLCQTEISSGRSQNPSRGYVNAAWAQSPSCQRRICLLCILHLLLLWPGPGKGKALPRMMPLGAAGGCQTSRTDVVRTSGNRMPTGGPGTGGHKGGAGDGVAAARPPDPPGSCRTARGRRGTGPLGSVSCGGVCVCV